LLPNSFHCRIAISIALLQLWINLNPAASSLISTAHIFPFTLSFRCGRQIPSANPATHASVLYATSAFLFFLPNLQFHQSQEVTICRVRMIQIAVGSATVANVVQYFAHPKYRNARTHIHRCKLFCNWNVPSLQPAIWGIYFCMVGMPVW
jgi:hypothetical protein